MTLHNFQLIVCNDIDTVIWIDVFSINQATMEVSKDFVKEFHSTLLAPMTSLSPGESTFTNVLLVCPILGDLVPLKNTWCLFEFYHISMSSNSLSVDFCMTAQQWKRFRKDVIMDEAAEKIVMLPGIPNINESVTRVTTVKDLLLEFMKDEMKVEIKAWSQNISKLVRDMVIQNLAKKPEFLSYLDGFDNIVKEKIKCITAYLYEDQGDLLDIMRQFSGAIEAFKQSLVVRGEMEQKNEKAILVVMKKVALLYEKIGQCEEALSMYKELYRKNEETYGESHQFTHDSLVSTGYMLANLERYEEACECLTECYEKRKQTVDLYHIDILTLMEDLAHVYNKLRKEDQCISILTSLLEMRRKMLPEIHMEIIETAQKLGDAYTRVNKYDVALPLYEEVLRKRRVILGEDHNDTLDSMAVLGFTHQKLGNNKLAIQFYEDSLHGRTLVLGTDHPMTQYNMQRLADLYYITKQNDKALPLYEFLFVQRKIMERETSLETLQSVGILAGIYWGMERFDQALPLYEACLERERELYRDNVDTLSKEKIEASMFILADLYMKREKYKQALKICEEIFDIKQKEGISNDDEKLLNLMYVLSDLYRQCNEDVKALSILTRLYETLKKKHGELNDQVLEVCMALADTYYESNRLKSAIPLYEEIYDSREKMGTVSDDDDDIYKVVHLCAKMHYENEKYEGALKYNHKLLNMMKKRLGPEHPEVVQILYVMADIYLQTSKYSEALPFLQECGELKEKVLHERLDDEKGELLLLKKTMMEVYTKDGKYQEAIPLYSEVLEAQEKLLGEEHDDVLLTKVLLADAYCRGKKWKKALPLYETLYEKRKKLLGPEHQSTRDSMNNLAFIYNKLGMVEKHAPLYKEVIFARELDRIEKLTQDGIIEEDKADQYIVELKQTAMDMLEISPPTAEEITAAIKREKEKNQVEINNALNGVTADGTKVKYRIVGELASEENNDTDDEQQDTKMKV